MKTLVLIMVAVISLGSLERNYSPTTSAQEEAERPEIAKRIKKYLDDNFGAEGYKTSWYDNITGVSVRGETVIARTDLDSKERRANSICSAVSGFVFSRLNRSLGLSNVQVHASDGQILVNRRGLSDPCS